MADLVSEGLLNLSKAARVIPKYFPTHKGSGHTARYWIGHGIVVASQPEPIKLEHVRINQTLYTSEQAIERFRDRVWAAENPHLKPAKKAKAKRLKNANRRLARAGA